jgi:hypothetical protein
MKLRYFVVDGRGCLRRVSRTAIEALWDGKRGAVALGCPDTRDLRLVSVACDDDFHPLKIYVLRLPLADGRFTLESRLTLRLFSRPDCVTAEELARHHTAGWPIDFYQQLAVALDTPAEGLDELLRVGGPLFLAAAMDVTPEEAMRYIG